LLFFLDLFSKIPFFLNTFVIFVDIYPLANSFFMYENSRLSITAGHWLENIIKSFFLYIGNSLQVFGLPLFLCITHILSIRLGQIWLLSLKKSVYKPSLFFEIFPSNSALFNNLLVISFASDFLSNRFPFLQQYALHSFMQYKLIDFLACFNILSTSLSIQFRCFYFRNRCFLRVISFSCVKDVFNLLLNLSCGEFCL